MLSQGSNRFAEILNAAVRAISKRERKNIAAVEAELGEEIGKSADTIEDWRIRKNRKALPHYKDLELLAKALRKRGQLQDPLYKEFLIAGGHPNPEKLLNPTRIDHLERAPHFIGRQNEINKLITSLQPGRKIYLWGPGGIGKSALVAEVIQKLTHNNEPPTLFPDGIVYYNFYGGYSIVDAFRYIAKFYSVEVPEQTQPRDVARDVLRNRQALLILDGTEDVQDLGKLVDEMRGRCGILIVTRYKQKDAIELNVLPVEQAVHLLQAWSSEEQDSSQFQVWSSGQEANHTIATAICELVGKLPLALRLAGSHMVKSSIKASEFLELLKKTPLSLLAQGERQHESIPVLLDKSLESLERINKDTRSVLATIGLLADAPFHVELVAIGLKIAPASILLALGESVKFSMVKRLADGRYQVVHRLIHTYAHERLTAPSRVIERLTAYYTALTRVQSEQGSIGYKILEPEQAHILAVLVGCVEQKKWEHVQNLAWAVDDYLNKQGYWTERIRANEYGLSAARALGDRRNEGGRLGHLGGTYALLEQYQIAIDYYQQALTVTREVDNRHDEGAWLGGLGNVYVALGQYDKAIEHHEQALAVNREIGDRPGEAHYLGNLGIVYNTLRQHQKAIEYHEQALAIEQEISRLETGHTLTNLGTVYANLGHHQKAIEYYEQALTIAQEIGDRRNEIYALGNLGITNSVLGQHQIAISYYHQAFAICHQIGYRKGETTWLDYLGNAYLALSQHKQAIEYHEQALAVSREIGNGEIESSILINLSNVYVGLHQYQRAIEYLEQALVVAKVIGDRKCEGRALTNLGQAYGAVRHYQKAIEYCEQALAIAQEIGDRQSEGATLGGLGKIYVALEQYQKAIEYCEQALAIAQEIGDRQSEGNFLGNLGNSYLSLRNYQKAIECYEHSLTIVSATGDRKIERTTLGNLGNAYADLKQYRKAIEYYEQALAIAQEIGDRWDERKTLGALGDVYAESRQYQKAIEHWQQALTIAREVGDPSREVRYLSNLGSVHRFLEQYQKAIEYYHQAVVVASKMGDHHSEKEWLWRLGDLYYFLGHYKEAIPCYQQVIQLDPTNLWVCTKLADAHLDLTQLNEAASFYHRCIKLYPDDAFHAYTNLGVLGRLQGKEIDAEKHFKKALSVIREKALNNDEREPSSRLLEDKALALLCLGYEEDALFMLEQSLDQRPPKENLHLTRYNLLAEALNPPRGLDKMRSLLESTERNRE